MLTIGAILFIIMFLLLAAITSILFLSYRESKSPAVKTLFNTFLFISLYALSLTTLSILAADYPNILIGGYNIAVVLAFLAISAIIRIPTFAENKFIYKNFKAFSWPVIFIGTIVICIQLIDPRIPIKSVDLIFWNASPIAAWLTGITILTYSLIWSFLTYKSALIVSAKEQRLKLYILAFDILCIGISAFLFFPSQNYWQSIASFMVIVPGYLITIIYFSYQKYIKPKHPAETS